jgi:hypothetical protein
LPCDLYSRDLAHGLCTRSGNAKLNQADSHIIFQTATPQPHRLAVPEHRPLRIGTLKAILREVAVASGVTPEVIFAALG